MQILRTELLTFIECRFIFFKNSIEADSNHSAFLKQEQKNLFLFAWMIVRADWATLTSHEFFKASIEALNINLGGKLR